MAGALSINFAIPSTGPLATAVRFRGYKMFGDVAAAIEALPYGRTSDSEDIAAVIEEGRGTCSSKHRFLAALAHECGHPELQLMVGLYEMSGRSMPGVEKILANEKLHSIPEAHCYLKRNSERFDFTGLSQGASSPFDSLIEEIMVSPADLPTFKSTYHREALSSWARQLGLEPEHAWAIRERCIAALTKQTM